MGQTKSSPSNPSRAVATKSPSRSMTASNQVSGAVLQMNQFKKESSSFWYVHHVSEVSAEPGYAGGGG